MDGLLGVITVAGVSMLILEGVKWLIKLIGKKPDFGFPTSFYVIMLPVLNAVVPFPLVWLGLPVEAPTLGMSLLEVIKYIILVVISSLISILEYNGTIKGLKERSKMLAGLQG